MPETRLSGKPNVDSPLQVGLARGIRSSIGPHPYFIPAVQLQRQAKRRGEAGGGVLRVLLLHRKQGAGLRGVRHRVLPKPPLALDAPLGNGARRLQERHVAEQEFIAGLHLGRGFRKIAKDSPAQTNRDVGAPVLLSVGRGDQDTAPFLQVGRFRLSEDHGRPAFLDFRVLGPDGFARVRLEREAHRAGQPLLHYGFEPGILIGEHLPRRLQFRDQRLERRLAPTEPRVIADRQLGQIGCEIEWLSVVELQPVEEHGQPHVGRMPVGMVPARQTIRRPLDVGRQPERAGCPDPLAAHGVVNADAQRLVRRGIRTAHVVGPVVLQGDSLITPMGLARTVPNEGQRHQADLFVMTKDIHAETVDVPFGSRLPDAHVDHRRIAAASGRAEAELQREIVVLIDRPDGAGLFRDGLVAREPALQAAPVRPPQRVRGCARQRCTRQNQHTSSHPSGHLQVP